MSMLGLNDDPPLPCHGTLSIPYHRGYLPLQNSFLQSIPFKGFTAKVPNRKDLGMDRLANG